MEHFLWVSLFSGSEVNLCDGAALRIQSTLSILAETIVIISLGDPILYGKYVIVLLFKHLHESLS